MKKSKAGQATLFQSWGHSAQQSTSSRNPNLNWVETKISQPQNGVYSAFDPNDILDLGDEDDDNQLLAAVEGIAPCDESNFGQANATSTNISCNPDEIEVIPGFDLEAGNVWIYPTNYPIRNYQYDIVEQAIYRNTLVTLPTGLGKTFIAAVVMYNFYRWYPQGKVIFMAPTKPLVAQQIEACFNIMGIPQTDTTEMTGNMAPNKRQSLWQSRRVFFLTPQVLQNDLNRGSCKAEEVVLLVADEAHKALGNHAYCQVVREISGYTRNFRVLALSATPGDDLEAVQQVITNLMISHMELRSEESPDIKPYTHRRQVEKVVVSLGEDISKIKASYLKVLESVVSRLFCQRALWQRDPQRVSKFLLLSARDQFRKSVNDQGGLDRNQQSRIEGDFAMCISLYHAYELLIQHGILSFYNFIKGIMDGTKGMARAKTEITKNCEFSQLMDELREEIEPPMENSTSESLLFSQFSPRRRALMNVPKPSATFKSHPKLMKLKEIVLEHFGKFQDKNGADAKGVATRVMIFSQYRDSVNEIAAMLAQHKPLVRVMSFIGQQSTGKSSRGLTQKEQLQVLQRFRQGGYNTLVATCVGEEGLDIGEVDLIVCFDAHASPIRLVQRMGRTGRKRDGRIVILVTEGKEEQVYQRSQRSKNSIHKAVTQAAKSFDLYVDNHRMVPRQLTPAVLKMEMTVGKFQTQSKGKKKGNSSDGANIKNFTSKSATTKSKKSDGFLTYEELVYWQEHFKLPDHEAGLSPQLSVTKRSRRSLSDAKKHVTQPSLTEWLPWQSTLNPVKAVTHSRRTEHFVELLEFTELHGGREDDDESYDLEMMSFLNEEDILKPGQAEGDNTEVHARANVCGCDENEGTSKNAKKGKKTQKKLQMEADAKDGGQNSRKEEVDEGISEKRNAKGIKKRSPENKARWKEFLKQFDNKDEDFESDGANAAVGSNKNIAVEDNHDDAEPGCDLSDVGEPCEQTNKTTEADIDETTLQQGCNKAKNQPVTPKRTKPVLDSESGNLSDGDSDELSNLLPSATPDFHNFNPGFKLQRTRFASTMVSLPTPPSLDVLDKISLSPASVELDEFRIENEEEAQKELRINPGQKEDKLVTSSAVSFTVSPKACFENDPLIEPFLMADFLEEDDDAKAEIEADTGNTLQSSLLEREDRITATSVNSSETCIGTSAEIFVNEATHKDIRKHVAQNSREVAKKDNTRGVTQDYDARGISKDADTDSKPANPIDDAQSGFGFGVRCGSPVNEFNECDDEESFPQEDAAFAEAFFMDGTDDDVFTNITSPRDDNVRENDTENDRHKPAARQELVSKGDRSRNIPCEIKESKESRTKTKRQSSKTVCESKEIERNVFGEISRPSVVVDIRASVSKLSVFQHNSTDGKTSSNLASNLATNPESDTRKKSKISKEIKRCLSEEALPMEAAKMLPVVEVRTRGEQSGGTAVQSGPGMLDCCRNTAAIPPVSTTNSPREVSNKLRLKAKHLRDTSLDGKTTKVENEDNNVGINVGSSTGNDTVNSVGNTYISNTGGNTSRSTGNARVNNTGNDAVDNVCRSPLPKKLKLSRKRTSPKEKKMLVTKTQTNQVKSLDFGSSNSLNLNLEETDFSGGNLGELTANCSSRTIERRNCENADKHPLPTVTAPKVSSVNCKDRSENLSNLRTHNGAVVAVMESEDEGDDEDEDVIRPAGKAISLRRQALSSPCSQEGFKRPANPEKQRDNHPRCLTSRIRQLGSESDEEFEADKSAVPSRSKSSKACQVKPSAQKRKSLEISAKQGTRKSLDSLRKKTNNKPGKHFLDDEAELSGSDINNLSSDEADEGDEGEMDSFIDDSTQLTQRTPTTVRPRHASSPMDMMAVYRQSLRSPLSGALNFETPAFHKQRNKYKMVYKYRTVDEDNESASEAEETNELESILENEVEEEDENEAEIMYENEAHTRCENEVSRRPGCESPQMNPLSHADKSFEESQIGRPVKRVKRKRILDDSFDEEVSPKLSKQRNLSETFGEENTIEKKSRTYNDTTQMGPSLQRTTYAFGNFLAKSKITENNLHSDFVKSSDVLADKRNFHDNHSALQRSVGNKESMRRSGSFIDGWDNDISDSELLIALEVEGQAASVKIPPPNDVFQDQDLKEIAVAMKMTDDDVAMEINELPTFSLGFDFLSETIFANSAFAGDSNSSKDNLATFTERQNENFSANPNIAVSQQKSSSTRNSAGIPSGRVSSKDGGASHKTEHFTKILECSKQTSERSRQPVNNSQVVNKASAERGCVSKVTSKSTLSNVSSLSSGQGFVSNSLSTTQTTTVAQIDGQRSVADAHAKLQVVTPSCRPNPLVTRPAISPLLTSSHKDKGKTVILVDTREISSSQVVSLLRMKHNIKAEVCQLTSCDYIVSNRMAVKRKTASDVANGANSPKLVECMRRMCDLYDRPCFIIEKDRVRPGETEKNFIKTKAYIFTLASIAQTHVKMMFSDSQEETAALLTELAAMETRKGTAITVPTSLNKEREQVFRVLFSIPRVSYIAALNLCSSYNTLHQIINSTAAELERRTPGLSSPRAAEIHKYFRHKFNPEMVVAKK